MPVISDQLPVKAKADGEEVILQEIADEMGISRSYVRKILAKGLAKLRDPSRARFLKPFWEEL